MFPLRSVGLDNSTVPVQSVAATPDGGLAIGTQWSLWRTLAPDHTRLHYSRVPGVLDLYGPTAMAALGSDLYLGTRQCAAVQHEDMSLERICGVNGLPQGNITCMAAAGGELWMGTTRGVVRRLANGSFRYYFGPRWLPTNDIAKHQNVLSIAVNNDNSQVAVVTTGGLSLFALTNGSLPARMDLYDAEMSRYTQTSPFKALPLNASLAGSGRLQYFGNLSSIVPSPNDNNGLWTSMFLIGEIFRYNVLKEPSVKERAWAYLHGMQVLVTASGIRGLPARSVSYFASDPNQKGSHQWQPSPTFPGYYWKSDTSSDEITGHIALYKVAYDLLCETPEEKAMVRWHHSVILRLVDRISIFFLLSWS